MKILLLTCSGMKWKEISAQTHTSWELFASWHTKEVKKVYDLAWRDRRGQAQYVQIYESAEEEAANDELDPVIGRVGKDKDGILKDDDGKPLFKKRHNTKMRELFLKAHDKRFRDSGSEQDKGAGSRPIVYNIAFLGGPASVQALPKAQAAIDATFTDIQGDKRAENSPFG